MTTTLGSYILVPGQYIGRKYQKHFELKRQLLCSDYNTKEIDIIAQDNIHLNAMLFRQPKSFFSHFKSKKILIRFGGNGENYESHASYNIEDSYIAKGHKLGYDVLLFNYRGIGKSKGTPSPEGLLQDGQAVLDFVLSQGYEPHNILVHGFSLGGAIATKTLASKQDQYKNIKFVNDRPFSSIRAVIKNFSILGFFKSILLFLLKICNWNIDITEDWKKLKNPKLLLFSLSDNIIPLKGSLAHKIKKINTDSSSNVIHLKSFRHCSDLNYKQMQCIIGKFKKRWFFNLF
jgi:hypothetical protein